ncbi:MAG: hypothetical protein A2X02_03085 [Bacteroidetes bacterium GWF2_29_10]|nr:MAG: hypothetical protein A2X02_03085 [Bacteroidetes bacterium GWF2_29_10]
MKFFLLVIFIHVILLETIGQDIKLEYWRIDFKDKQFNTFKESNPKEFLSKRSIERRQKNHVDVTIEDLPVTKLYVDSVCKNSINYLYASKWFNSIVVTGDSFDVANTMLNSFVKGVFKLHEKYITKKMSNDKAVKNVNFNELIGCANQEIYNKVINNNIGNLGLKDKSLNASNVNYNYGYSFNQIDLLNGVLVHEKGYTGKDIIIGVLDGGFNKLQDVFVFDNLIVSNRIIAVKDYVDNEAFDFSGSTHGTQVLSVMAGDKNGVYVGTAPDASYVLLRTEDTRSESPLEEENWISGIEFADSLGVDIINSSLGYTTFDNTKYNHKYSDSNGNTTRISIAGNKAFSKGMVIVNSAGNSGESAWGYIGFPSDAENVLAVGAVDAQLKRALFSSYGPTVDNRIKPDVVAQGKNVLIVNHYGDVTMASGTSFAAPLITGLTACLLQAYPMVSAKEIVNSIKRSASQYTSSDNYYGYGIPNFYSAYIFLSNKTEESISVFPNPFKEDLNIMYSSYEEKNIDVFIYNNIGQLMLHKEGLKVNKTKNIYLFQEEISGLMQGLYYIIIKDKNTKYSRCLLKE